MTWLWQPSVTSLMSALVLTLTTNIQWSIPIGRRNIGKSRLQVLVASIVSRAHSWSAPRLMIREAAAEFTGVALIIIFGNGADCQVILSMNNGVAASPRGVGEVVRFVKLSLKCNMNRIGCLSILAGGLESQWVFGWQVEFLEPISILLCVAVISDRTE